MGPVSLETPELPHPSRHVGHREEMLSMTQEAAVTRGQVCRPLDLELPASQTLSSQCCSQTAQSVVFLSQELAGDGGVGQGGRQEWWLASPRGAGSPRAGMIPLVRASLRGWRAPHHTSSSPGNTKLTGHLSEEQQRAQLRPRS